MITQLHTCTGCRKARPANEFHRNASKRDGIERRCRDCAADRKLQGRYGITRDGYRRLFADQGGVCAICAEPAEDVPLVVDHQHGSGQVRGLLCHGCNTGIGLLKDNPATLLRAAAYLGIHN
ncbi:endonuclease VII domain-containing protein [Nocardia pseudobrasiliensis]|uniref:Recombination endonuclease VII n=1 Tax=Nocardia pseudobrasiliensis TaxID=45979 RepID=A0A370I580_9NOCA|nr:endonuclease VII domain-containing protein [Nocardia pseudobrasiliensis]RDI65760.1 recombination endonuclease VII [Nocardia pseudobrasiliensis]